MNSVRIRDRIGLRNEFCYVSSDKLTSFIEEYGIDYIDDSNECLLDLIKHMSFGQINLVFKHKPNLITQEKEFVCFSVMTSVHDIYAFGKMLECDDNFVVLREKTRYIVGPNFEKPEIKTYKEMLNELSKCMLISQIKRDSYSQMLEMLEEHEKRYKKTFSFFGLMWDKLQNKL